MSKSDMAPNANKGGGGRKKKTQRPRVQPPTLPQEEEVPVPVKEVEREEEQEEKKKVNSKLDEKQIQLTTDSEEDVEVTNAALKKSCDDLVDFSSDNDRCSQNYQAETKQEEKRVSLENKVAIGLLTELEDVENTPVNNQGTPAAPPRKSAQHHQQIIQKPVSMPSPLPVREGPNKQRQSMVSYNKGQIARPTIATYSDSSLVSHMAGMMNEVIARAQSQPAPTGAEKPEWIQLTSIEKAGNPREKLDVAVVGLSRGYQIWTLNACGEFEEVLSERQGPIRACKILPYNIKMRGRKDMFDGQRPLMAVVDASSHVPDRQYCSLQIISISSGKVVDQIRHDEPICAVNASDQYLVLSLSHSVYVYDIITFAQVKFINTAPSCDSYPPAVAITGQMLAYADAQLNSEFRSAGGLATEVEANAKDNYSDQFFSAVNMFTRGVKSIGETVGAKSIGSSSSKSNHAQGIVTVLDLTAKGDESATDGVLCHWIAHVDPISYLTFSPDQRMIVTADSSACVFNVFLLLPHPASSSLAAVQHLYKLNRGSTVAKGLSTSFSLDCRWLAISTNHGTCHVFPICPFGGRPTQRTHSENFVNKESRFQRSAGLTDEADVTATLGLNKHKEMSNKSLIHVKEHPAVSLNGPFAKCSGNSRVGPFPPPLRLSSTIKIKEQFYSREELGEWAFDLTGMSPTAASASTAARRRLEVSRVSVSFSTRSSNARTAQSSSSLVLLIGKVDSTSGVAVIEHELAQMVYDPKSADAKLKSEDPPTLTHQPKLVWSLQRTKNNSDLHLPMPIGSPLINLAIPSTVTASNNDQSKEPWAPFVEFKPFLPPHRWLWQGPQIALYEYKDEDQPDLMSPNEKHWTSFKSVPIIIDGAVPIKRSEQIDEDSTRIEMGSYSSNHVTAQPSMSEQETTQVMSLINDALNHESSTSSESTKQINRDEPEVFYASNPSPNIDGVSSSTKTRRTPAIAPPPTSANHTRVVAPTNDEDDEDDMPEAPDGLEEFTFDMDSDDSD